MSSFDQPKSDEKMKTKTIIKIMAEKWLLKA